MYILYSETIHMFLGVWFQRTYIVYGWKIIYLVSLVNLMKYSHNCKHSGVYMVTVYGLVAITCIINMPFDNKTIRTSNGHVRCRYVGMESIPNFQCQVK